jgi:hypothetical protein
MAKVTLVVNSQTANCVTGTGGWLDTAFPAQSGTFTASFDAIPSSSTGHGIFGIAHGAPTTNGGFANVIAFNTNGTVVALNGGTYLGSLTYVSGATYHFRLAINVPAHTYSIFMTPPSGGEQALGTDFQFRTGQNMVTSLDHYGVSEGVAGDSLQVCSFTIQ